MPHLVRCPRWLAFALCLVALAVPLLGHATFSIVACDDSGSCGVAVATDNLAVGASVPYAQADVGALASQFETNPHDGPAGLALLVKGMAASAALSALLASDGGFDGGSVADRQLGLVDAAGRSASYTGETAQAAAWAGARQGHGYAVQGNGLAGEAVLAAMEQAFRQARGALALRLMASLVAGQAAGGQRIGKMSAALLVRTRAGDWQDIDLRVDGAAAPIEDLNRLLDQHYALQAIVNAEHQWQRGHADAARTSLALALSLSHGWDRIGRRAARLALAMGDRERALDCLAAFAAANPVWAREELRDALYDPLRGDARFPGVVAVTHR